jgi:hypothetical protein
MKNLPTEDNSAPSTKKPASIPAFTGRDPKIGDGTKNTRANLTIHRSGSK